MANIDLSPGQKIQFETLMRELLAWNQKLNLTSITNKDEIEIKHFLDSLSVVDSIPKDAKSLVDIGSGAGFPGIPIKIVRPDLKVTLLETAAKKVAAMQSIISTLGLSGIEAIQARAEDAGRDPKFREHFDVATARAVAALPVLVEYALPLIRPGGILIAQKTAGQKEIEDAENAIRILGGKLKEVLHVKLPSLADRQLVVIEKISITPPEYPRRAGLPTKKPL